MTKATHLTVATAHGTSPTTLLIRRSRRVAEVQPSKKVAAHLDEDGNRIES